MDRARFSRVKELFQRAVALSAAEREALLQTSCADDTELAREVRDLLVHAQQAGGFLDRAATPGATPPAPVSRIPGFELREQLAVGTSGTVYRAVQIEPKREVALKVLRIDSLAPGLVARFRREAQILAQLDHPGIARVIASGVLEDGALSLPWMALEFVAGATLDDFIAAKEPSTEQRVQLFAQICDAVEHAHAMGIVHRDLKPSNVMIDGAGRPHVIDFGIARGLVDEPGSDWRTHTGTLIGTLAYMAPEQTRGERAITPACDVYALGCMLYECLAGRLPLEIDELDLIDAVEAIGGLEPAPLRQLRPDLPRDLETILLKALEKDALRRYRNAGALGADLRNWLAHRPVLARRATAVYQALKFARRNRPLILGAVLVVALLSIALVQTLRRLHSEQRGNERMSALTEAMSSKFFGLSERLGFGEQDRSNAEELIALIEAQLALDPGYRPLRVLLTKALEDVGDLHWSGRDFEAAEAKYRRAFALCEQLAQEDPEDRQNRSRASRLCARLGETARERGDLDERNRRFDEALARDEELVARFPDDLELREDLGWSLGRSAEVAAERGDQALAMRLNQRRLNDAEELVRQEPENWKYVRNLSSAHHYMIRQDPAGDHHITSVRLARREAELRVGARDARTWLVFALMGQAERLGSSAPELGASLEACAIAQHLVREDPYRLEHLSVLLTSCAHAVWAQEAAGRHEEALATLRECIALAAPLVNRPGIDNYARVTCFEWGMRELRLLRKWAPAAKPTVGEEQAWKWLHQAAASQPGLAADLRACSFALVGMCGELGASAEGFMARFFEPLLKNAPRSRAVWFADELSRHPDLSESARAELEALRRTHGF